MRALTWHGRHDVRVDSVPDPEIVNPRDAILKVTSTAICGSDLHLYDGYIPTLRAGDVLGHEFMGEVVEVGPKSTLEKGQRVVVPFTISCGDCFFCKKQQYSACDNSNPAETFEASRLLMGHPMGAAFGYAHLTGGYAGGQAEYVRVPYSDVGPIVIPDHLDDDQVLFLSDILPTGWMGAENAEIEEGDTVAVWGCGPVGLFAIQSAKIMGAHRVIAIDHYPHRLELAKQMGAEILDYREVDVREALDEMTGGIGPDACIDCVGMESHGLTIDNIADTVKAHTFLGTERPHAL
ncbi:MAG TPA: alcohol dehydrogenase catalytic domain-containing protein, partial [Sphingomicrobium sp.]|nr:alcohol dehydrogenase catalytic domain-containing protein [Sphingomicrobium sp.]